MTIALIIPGLNSSGPDHWQTWFEHQIGDTIRVIQRDWRDASLPDWTSRIRREISRNEGKFLLVGHSFGALAAAQAGQDFSDRIAGALLVAPADPERFEVADVLPAERLDFPTIVVASTTDPWIDFDVAARWAHVWGAEFVSLGAAGHVNAAAGFGPWPEGLALLDRVRRRSVKLAEPAQLDVSAAALPPPPIRLGGEVASRL